MNPLHRTLLLLLLLTACGSEPNPALETDEFVEVYVELRKAALTDSIDFERARDSIFSVHGMEAADLEDFIATADPQLLSDAWTTIAARLEEPDSVAADSIAADSVAADSIAADTIDSNDAAQDLSD